MSERKGNILFFFRKVGCPLFCTVLVTGSGLYRWCGPLKRLLGAAPVASVEAYRRKPDGLRVDHSAFDALLRDHVDDDGWVDYEALKRHTAALDSYIASLARVPLEELGRDERLALLINAYNAFTIRLILDYYPLKSIKDIPRARRWDDRRWRIGGLTLSLNEIEHQQIRPKFVEPRVHFALVCAAVGCPKLRNQAYDARRLDEQLEDQARYAHEHGRWFRYQPDRNVVYLTKLYDWYGGDFKQVAGSVLGFAARYSPPLEKTLVSGKKPRVKWLAYDWALNDRKNAH